MPFSAIDGLTKRCRPRICLAAQPASGLDSPRSSSANLNEPINSMCQWYLEAKICYVYLSDVTTCDLSADDSSFRQSAWFTRGWTLQELIAPAHVDFYNASWGKLGTKAGLKTTIMEITHIDMSMLEDGDPDAFSVTKRMSWASKRTTTRRGDRAYSLLGLFGINMPMVYGEGNRAFLRLQEEIMKHSDDQSIFAWTRGPYSVTNKGLSIEMPMVPWAMETYLVALDCERDHVDKGRIGIYLQLVEEEEQYARVPIGGADSQICHMQYTSEMVHRAVYVRQKECTPPPTRTLYGFWIRTAPQPINIEADAFNNRSINVETLSPSSGEGRMLIIPTGSSGTAGSIRYRTGSHTTTFTLGFDVNFNPICQWDSPINSHRKLSAAEAEADPSSMTSNFIHKRSRCCRYIKEAHPYRIVLAKETISSTKIWVLDIIDRSKLLFHPGISCGGCYTPILGRRYECRECTKFNYCDICYLTALETHPWHGFETIETPRDDVREHHL
ncbi:hypothetical protein QQS21_012744 [Conoideocrella luteorostrata]|uniref:ZZ-type domain-containing protein n=1 Tax=Conoideocrella luteorostrata TaxID=1105319 RepID=A0AAJ0FUJ4_9HYPO|nr:hypothetical protein QQS21_012744 [Conoideocrella luteorostrata]